ncbi:hypothetical protein [Paracoccus sediminicola]|uniref:hypothetical protein n=1 Tax=Paracoccus sediminicola TaxID=3017783 RepID=UPI0022EFF8FA|nr:hypothetical protein [Paracoccus sediminicola]WBU58298.1 hypothetical protein PAF18_07720 [Paracoccus sediminicola]
MTFRIHLAAALLALALAGHAAAQQFEMPQADEPPPGQTAPDRLDGPPPLSELERELDGIMGDVLNRLQPHLDGLGNELADTMNEFSPALGELSGLIDDFGNYHRPERLENGDIIIRRRADAPPPPSTEELQKLLPEGGERQERGDQDWAPPRDETPALPQIEL